jgi:hypothetical protein
MKTNFSYPRPVNDRDPPIHNFGRNKVSAKFNEKPVQPKGCKFCKRELFGLQRQFDYSRKLTSQKTLSEELNRKVINENASGKAMISPEENIENDQIKLSMGVIRK